MKLFYSAAVIIFISFSASLYAEDKPFSLDYCIGEALKKNPLLARYRNRMEQAGQDFLAKKTFFRPFAYFEAGYDRLSYVSPQKQRFIGDSGDDYRIDFALRQPVFTGGRLTAEKDAAGLAKQVSGEDYRAVQLEIVYEVKTAYHKLLFSKEILKIRNDLLEHAQDFFDTSYELNRRTRIPRAETLLRIKAQLNEAKQEKIAAETEVLLSRQALLLAMGRDIGGELDIEENQGEDSPILSAEGVRNNPEWRKTELEIKKSEKLADSARGDFYPQVNLQYRYGYEWSFEEGGSDWGAGLELSLPLWDWGLRRANLKRTRFFSEETKEAAEMVRRKLTFELERASLTYLSAGKKLEPAGENLEKMKESSPF